MAYFSTCIYLKYCLCVTLDRELFERINDLHIKSIGINPLMTNRVDKREYERVKLSGPNQTNLT